LPSVSTLYILALVTS